MNDNESQDVKPDEGLLSKHPRLVILLIAGVFYLILCASLFTIIVLALRS